MPVLSQPDSSGLDNLSASRYGVQINLGTALAPNWAFIYGLQTWGPKFDGVDEDDTDIASDGFASEARAGNAFTVEFKGLVKGEDDGEDFVADPGMWALVVASEAADSEGHVHLRYWHKKLPIAREFFATVKATLEPGKPNELQKFGGNMTGRGKPKDITKPGAALKLHYGYGLTSYTATVDGQTTASLTAATATTGQIKTAFEALSNVDTAVVTGAAPDFEVEITPSPTVASVTATPTGAASIGA
ncbi:MAG: hypothetical protein DI630_16870 [Gordonia sp. (in: high G+C Gram-positive bacteria)]|nr:MAG: hypothetical protein DI630_16870 [Gordonia sp. (in: high G+C Gram-positive bacteria)]